MRIAARRGAIVGCALILAAAGSARAEYLKFEGTHAIRFSHNGVIREVSKTGTGYALVQSVAGDPLKLNKLEILPIPFATIDAVRTGAAPGTMGTTVLLSNEVPEIRFEKVAIDRGRAGLKGAPGVFAPIHGALAATMGMLSFNTLPAKGNVRLCFAVLQPCKTGGTIAVDLSQTETTLPSNMKHAIGPGVGSDFIATGMSGTMVTVSGNPWTIRTAAASYVKPGGVGVLTGMGFAKGPAAMGSMLGSTLASGGVGGMLQLVTPIQAVCDGACGGSNDPAAQIARLTLTFQPEPDWFASLCAGAAALALLGRTRVGR